MKIIIVGLARSAAIWPNASPPMARRGWSSKRNPIPPKPSTPVLDVLTIAGDGAGQGVLKRAIEAVGNSVDLLMAVTDQDGVNALACHSATTLGISQTVARISDSALRSGLHNMGVKVVIDPDEATADELVRLVKLSGLSGHWEFADGRLLLVGAIAQPSTTGYSTADFGLWTPSMQLLVLALMTLGGMAGSAAGGIKIFRLKVVANTALTELRRVIHPRGMFIIRLNKRPLPTHIIRGVFSFLVLYLFLLGAGALVFITIESSFGSSDLVTSLSAVVASLGNIGPGLGEVGPAANYALVSPPGKWLLSLLMIVGRLEIFPILVLAMPSVWRK